MTAAIEGAKALGYQTATVIAHIIDMDVDAAGNAEKAAWKRYLVLILLAQAKAVDKKKLIEAVFGKAGKASKTFQNMWGVGNAARNVVLGNRTWDDIRAMNMAEARDTVLLSINAHMSSLEVSSKNEYEKVCMLSPSEAAAKREADAKAKAEADAAKAAEAEAKTEAAAEAETEAQDKAQATPERTPAQAAIGALMDAGRDDLMQVAAHIVTRIGMDDIRLMHEALTAMMANAAKTITIDGDAAQAA